MNKTLILAVVAIALGLFVYFYEIEGGKEREKLEAFESSLLKIEDDDIQSVTLIQEEGNLIKYQRLGDSWEIIQPIRTSVEESAINGNYSAFINANIKRKLNVTKEKLKNFGLQPENVEVIIESKDGKILDLLIGDQSPTRGDLFVAFRDSNTIFISSDNLKTQSEKTLFELRDKKIAHFNKDDVRRIELITKTHTILFDKDDETWFMRSPNLPVEQTRINGFLSSLTNYSAKSFIAENFEDKAKFGFNNPEARVKLNLGEEMALKEIIIGSALNEGGEDVEFYGYESGRSPVFTIRQSTKDDLDRSPFYFQDKQLARFEKETVNKIRISGAYQITLIPEDTLGWYVHSDSSFKVNDSDINRIFSAIEGVSASELISNNLDKNSDYGFQDPFLEIVINDTSNNSVGFIIGNADDDNDRYALSKGFDRVYLTSIFQVERIIDWIEEILGSEEEQKSD
ncbi:MAG: hypothetical protein CMG75_10470 [Candidatus Marinimicrobia bacterium]|nr:hypothetical protein [Candidatus Neomarinimicrobiota bacterium]|tara:strand:+ start:9481 stop:10848 length:1368 start_codon:yes stop_codon:yes gene_type:complete